MVVRGHTEELTPLVGLQRPEGVKRAMKDDGGHTLAVRRERLVDKGGVGNIGKAFVVHDDVITLGKAGLRVDAQFVPWVAVLMENLPLDVGPGADAFGEYLFLPFVVVKTTAGDEQCLNGFDRWVSGPRHAQAADGNQEQNPK